jgi:hypothetical protein
MRLGLFCPPPISQPCESIARLHIRVLPIFPSRLSSYPRDVGGTAWPQAMYTTTWPAAVCPRTAVLAQDCSREESVTIFEELVCRLLLWRNGCDVLVGYFAQDFGHESHLRFGCPRMNVRRMMLVNCMGVTHRHVLLSLRLLLHWDLRRRKYFTSSGRGRTHHARTADLGSLVLQHRGKYKGIRRGLPGAMPATSPRLPPRLGMAARNRRWHQSNK